MWVRVLCRGEVDEKKTNLWLVEYECRQRSKCADELRELLPRFLSYVLCVVRCVIASIQYTNFQFQYNQPNKTSSLLPVARKTKSQTGKSAKNLIIIDRINSPDSLSPCREFLNEFFCPIQQWFVPLSGPSRTSSQPAHSDPSARILSTRKIRFVLYPTYVLFCIETNFFFIFVVLYFCPWEENANLPIEKYNIYTYIVSVFNW